MTIKKGDFVRAINPKLGLPPGGVWVADLAGHAAIEDALDSLTPAPLPAGWGTSPRRAPTAATYKPAHGGYPGKVKA